MVTRSMAPARTFETSATNFSVDDAPAARQARSTAFRSILATETDRSSPICYQTLLTNVKQHMQAVMSTPLDDEAVAAADKEMEARANRAKELLSKRYHGLKKHQVRRVGSQEYKLVLWILSFDRLLAHTSCFRFAWLFIGRETFA